MQAELKTTIDHVIVGAYFLDDGVNFIYEQLGVKPESGGKHLTMGTHNKLLNLGNKTYLEVIAIDPGLSKPGRPRWFGLDNLTPESKPRLLTWVVRTNNIQQAVNRSRLQNGKIESLRRGKYNWQIFIADSGQMPMEGLTPSIIQWNDDTHPASDLPDSGVTLIGIEAFHPDATELNNFLTAIGYDKKFTANTVVSADDSRLEVVLKCPKGIIRLNSPGLA